MAIIIRAILIMATVIITAVIMSVMASVEIYRILTVAIFTVTTITTVTRATVATVTIIIIITGTVAVATIVVARSRPILSLYINTSFTLFNEEYSLETLWIRSNTHSLFDLKIHSYFPACPISTGNIIIYIINLEFSPKTHGISIRVF